MIHRLTIGHLKPEAVRQRRIETTRPLDMEPVRRLLSELGGTDPDGTPTLGGARVEISEGTVSVPWMGGRTNRVAEEFALRMQKETGCLLADIGHGRVIDADALSAKSTRGIGR